MTDEYNAETEAAAIETATPAADADSKRAGVSKRIILNSEGVEQENEVGAAAVRYESLTEGFARTVKLDDLPTDMLYAYAAWGLLTRLGNAANSVRNAKGNRSANAPQTEAEAIDRMIEQTMQSLWTSPSGEGIAGSGLLAEAIVAAKAKWENKEVDIDAVRKWLDTQDKAAKKALRDKPAIKAELARLQAERAAARAADLAKGMESAAAAGGDLGLGI